MPRNKSKPKKTNLKESEREKSGRKRKVISPLDKEYTTKDITQDNSSTQTAAKECTTENHCELKNQNKRFHSNNNNSNQIFTFENINLPSGNTLDMSYQQATYGAPCMPSMSPPGYVPQSHSVTPNSVNNIHMQMPPWASLLFEEMKSLKSGISRIEEVEKTVNIINTRFSDLDVKVTSIDKRVGEVEKSCTYMSKEFDTTMKKLNETRADIDKMKHSTENFEAEVTKLNKEIKTVTERLNDSEFRSMRNNLIFYGIQERPDENCENIVKQLINDKIDINANAFMFDRAHRLGKPTAANQPRPIVVRFTYHKERETVRTKAYSMNDALKREGYGVGIQRPKNVRDARKALYHVMKQAQDRGQTAKFYGDKLYINGELYVPKD
jgi:uncharacterized protein (DUF2267 family)/prefoldin subunit 5